MDPIGASTRGAGTVRQAWVEIDGERVQSVSGGGHWGGGMCIDAYDMARFGYFARDGASGATGNCGREVGEMARTPAGLQSPYGSSTSSSTPTASRGRRPGDRCAPRQRRQHVYVDPENDLVAVVRWIDNNAVDGFLKRLIAAVAAKS